MYKNLALINGSILAIMIFLNGRLASITGPYLGTLIFHLVGLVVIVIVSMMKHNRLPAFKDIPPVFFLPGVLSVITILLNNLCIPQIGITLTTGVSLSGQLVMSCLVEHFGLFGMPVNPFRREKVFGFTLIALGIVAMITL